MAGSADLERLSDAALERLRAAWVRAHREAEEGLRTSTRARRWIWARARNQAAHRLREVSREGAKRGLRQG